MDLEKKTLILNNKIFNFKCMSILLEYYALINWRNKSRDSELGKTIIPTEI